MNRETTKAENPDTEKFKEIGDETQRIFRRALKAENPDTEKFKEIGDETQRISRRALDKLDLKKKSERIFDRVETKLNLQKKSGHIADNVMKKTLKDADDAMESFEDAEEEAIIRKGAEMRGEDPDMAVARAKNRAAKKSLDKARPEIYKKRLP